MYELLVEYMCAPRVERSAYPKSRTTLLLDQMYRARPQEPCNIKTSVGGIRLKIPCNR